MGLAKALQVSEDDGSFFASFSIGIPFGLLLALQKGRSSIKKSYVNRKSLWVVL